MAHPGSVHSHRGREMRRAKIILSPQSWDIYYILYTSTFRACWRLKLSFSKTINSVRELFPDQSHEMRQHLLSHGAQSSVGVHCSAANFVFRLHKDISSKLEEKLAFIHLNDVSNVLSQSNKHPAQEAGSVYHIIHQLIVTQCLWCNISMWTSKSLGHHQFSVLAC